MLFAKTLGKVSMINSLLLVATSVIVCGCASGGSGCKACGRHGAPAPLADSSYAMARGAGAAAPPAAGAAQYAGQKTCPVAGEPLGSMGPAIPVTVKGQTIFVCCEGCVAEVESNPDGYLAKVAAERGSR